MPSEERRFFGKEIAVTVEGELQRPVSFSIDDEEHIVDFLLMGWHDYGFGEGPQRKHRWWQRHHRNYYRAMTTEGRIFEIYYDRGVSLASPQYKKWYVTKELPGSLTPKQGDADQSESDH